MYKNMKIEITDEVHLNAVCDVLESMGYKKWDEAEKPKFIVCHGRGGTYQMVWNDLPRLASYPLVNLTDLLAIRDKQFMEKIHAAD